MANVAKWLAIGSVPLFCFSAVPALILAWLALKDVPKGSVAYRRARFAWCFSVLVCALWWYAAVVLTVRADMEIRAAHQMYERGDKAGAIEVYRRQIHFLHGEDKTIAFSRLVDYWADQGNLDEARRLARDAETDELALSPQTEKGKDLVKEVRWEFEQKREAERREAEAKREVERTAEIADESPDETTDLNSLVKGNVYCVSGFYPSDAGLVQNKDKEQLKQRGLITVGKFAISGVGTDALRGDYGRRVYVVGRYTGTEKFSLHNVVDEPYATVDLQVFANCHIAKEVRMFDWYGRKNRVGEEYEIEVQFENRVGEWYIGGSPYNNEYKLAFRPTSDMRGLSGNFLVDGVFTGFQEFTTVLGVTKDVPCLDQAKVRFSQ